MRYNKMDYMQYTLWLLAIKGVLLISFMLFIVGIYRLTIDYYLKTKNIINLREAQARLCNKK